MLGARDEENFDHSPVFTMKLKKSFQPRKHTQDTNIQYLPGATVLPFAGDGGAGVKLMILSVFFRVIPWQIRFIG